MNKNYSEQSLESFKNKKRLIFTKPKSNDIPKYKKRAKLLFEDSSHYLKMPSELDFNFIIGKKHKVTDETSDRKITKNPTRKFIKMLSKRVTRFKSSNSISLDIKKAFELNKNANQKNREDSVISHKEISNIFKRYRNCISKSEINNKKKDFELSEEIPSFMKKYISSNLNQQEKALKYRDEYNNLCKKMEDNISRIMLRDGKELKKHRKYSEKNFYETANLFKNSVNNYRNKAEIINLNNNKKKKKSTIIDNHIRNWEMSLRKPKNFIGLRKGYLNINSDKRPIWIMATEKCPFEEEKIINPNNNYLNIESFIKKNYNNKSKKILLSKMKKKIINLRKYSNLKIDGKKLIDFEETQAENLNGNIKILEFKYDNDSTKDCLFKMNCSINKYLLEQKGDSFNEKK